MSIKDNKNIKIFIRLLQISITSVLFVYLIHKIDFSRVFEIVASIDKSMLIISFIVLLAAQTLYFSVWFFVVRKLGMRVPIKHVVSFSFQSLFVNNFLTFVGGDIYRGVKLNSITKSRFDTTFSIMITRFLMIFTLFIMAGVSLVLFGDVLDFGRKMLWTGVAVLFICLLYILLVGISSRSKFFREEEEKNTFIRKISDRLINNHIIIGENFTFFLFLMLLNIAGHVTGFFSIWILSRSLELHLSFLYIIIFMPLLRILLMVPVSFNGVGIREVSFVAFLTRFGFQEAEALSLGLMQSFLTVSMSLLGGILLVSEFIKRNKDKAA